MTMRWGIRPKTSTASRPSRMASRIAPARSTKFQAGDRIWHLGRNEPAMQNYRAGPALIPGVRFELEVTAQGDDYTVFLTSTQTGERKQITAFNNTDTERGRSPGFIGVQSYAGNAVAWRQIRVKSL